MLWAFLMFQCQEALIAGIRLFMMHLHWPSYKDSELAYPKLSDTTFLVSINQSLVVAASRPYPA
jgi:hypothetical protein